MLHGGHPVSKARGDACRNPAPLEQFPVPRSFLRGSHVLAGELIPLSARFPPALIPQSHPHGHRGDAPHRGPPLPAAGGCGQGGCGSAAAYGFRSAKTSAGAERAESTSPLLRGFSSQWGGGGCLNPPVIPQPAGGLLASPPAEQGRFGGDKGGRSSAGDGLSWERG